MNFCNSFNLTQTIERSTRITETSESSIDVILTSNKSLISKANVFANSISDHDLIVASLTLKKPRPRPTYISTRSFKNFKKDAFLDDISNAPWFLIDIFDDTDDKLDTFNSLFHHILDQHAPVKTVKLRTRPNPFIDDNIRSLMRSRDHWQRLAWQTNDPAIWSGYHNFRREVNHEIWFAQREFVEEQIRHRETILFRISSFSPRWNVLRLKVLLIQYLTIKLQESTKYHLEYLKRVCQPLFPISPLSLTPPLKAVFFQLPGKLLKFFQSSRMETMKKLITTDQYRYFQSP